MIKRCISKDWKFKLGTGSYTSIDLPHDYAIGQTRSAECNGSASNGFFPDENGRYVKYLDLNAGKHYILDIDGAYMRTQVFMNENYIAWHPHGYTPFLVDLSPYVLTGSSNKLVITTSPLPNSTRWYSGNGIYRDVFLWEGGDIRIEPWDMFVSTASIEDGAATVRLKFTVSSDRATDALLRFDVTSPDKGSVKTEELSMQIKSCGKTENEYIIKIEDPQLWDIDAPNLYTLKTEIFENGSLTDTLLCDFGIRTISADAKNGLLLNGKPIKLRGGCIHHDHGVLGAAAFPAAEARKIRRLKQTGFNAIRTAHNPPSLALLECCDRMGMIVMDEAFDAWNKEKCPNDYHWYFEDWCERDISYMVKRDRNHPCVFSYSIGNEIFEIDGTSDAAKWSRLLSDEIRKHDDTRLVTSGIQKAFVNMPSSEDIDPDDYKKYIETKHRHHTPEEVNRTTADYEAPLDIVGCNYYYDRYISEHAYYPERVIWGSETHSVHFYDSWQLTKENSYIIGDFTWTAIDNLGEVGTGRSLWARDGVIKGISLAEYPWRCCYQGDLDLCGYRLPRSYFREAVWLGNTETRIFVTHPEHFGEGFSGTEWHWYDVHESWSFDDKYIGQPIKAETYTDAEKIVWYVNDEIIGESIPEKGIASINTVYKKGSITAVAYKNGKECSRYTLNTTGPAAVIDVVAEQNEFLADNRDLCYFDISVTDTDDNIIAEAENEITCTVTGGELMGIFSGCPCNEDEYTSSSCHTFKGRALAIVRTKKAGVVGIKVYADGLSSGYAQVIAKEPSCI